jgi:fused signal recognition particle receptor
VAFSGLFDRLRRGLEKTRAAFGRRLRQVAAAFRGLDAAFLADIEETLLGADIGVETTQKILDGLREAHRRGEIAGADAVLAHLRADLRRRLGDAPRTLATASPAPEPGRGAAPPAVILVVGVNGSGKTTSIAKLAHALGKDGRRVLLAAADTFRAAAVEQLAVWSGRVGADLVRHQTGADPAAVVFDACDAALARKADVLIVDTAGRLQTKVNLMKELEKIRGVLARKIPGAPHETLLVLDATTGQNALSQAAHFREAAPITGIFLAKLDGTAKGGIVVALHDAFGIPVKFVGVGESPEDVEPFDPDRFVEALFE